MGAWDLGPFDNDGALDLLAHIAEHCGATSDENSNIDASIVDQDKLLTTLRELLTALTSEPAKNHQHTADECGDAYAAVGLIAAALTGTSDQPAGTTLFNRTTRPAGAPGGAGLNLHAHCGYLAIVSRSTAYALRQNAAQTAAALLNQTDWLSMWKRPEDLRAIITHLAALLTALAAI